jgi:pyridoxal phosphate enzyme (YggS family)
MNTIAANLQAVTHRIAQACALRDAKEITPRPVKLLAVSKTFPAQAVVDAAAAGQREFGENYIQEGADKIQALRNVPGLIWHMIGPIQSNKTKLVAEHFDWVHTVDRLKIAERLSDQRPAHLPPLQVLVQVNIDSASTKSGVPPAELLPLAQQIQKLPRLQLRGIMCMPDPVMAGDTIDSIATEALFMLGSAQFSSLNASLGGGLDALSMGMSADLEPAVAAGSTMVRVGSAIFGARTSSVGR